MATQQSPQMGFANVTAIRRRQTLAGLLAGAAMTLPNPAGISEARQKKKRKKCKKPNTCPQRTCCTCRDPMTFVDVLCEYIAASESFLEGCTTFCESQSLDLHQASGAVPDQANYCAHDLKCVRLDCPVT